MQAAVSRRTIVLGGTALGFGLFGRALTATAADYPHLSKLTAVFQVGAEVGGGADLSARVLARHMERLCSGLRIDIKNVPQAGGKLGGKMLQEGPSDGSMLYTSSPGLLSGQVLGEEGVAYDLSTWSWVGKIAGETRLLVRGPGADFTTLAELQAKKTPSPFSVRSTTSFTYHEVLWANAMLGLRIKPVPGYKSVEKDLAVLNGEVMLTTQSYPNDRQMLEAPEIDVVMRLNDGERPGRFADRPLLPELLADKPALQPALRFMAASNNLFRWVAAPPATEPEILDEWRRLFDSTVASPEFIADASKLDFNIAPMSGPEVAAVIGEVLAEQAKLRAQLSDLGECGVALSEGLEGSCGAV